MIGKIALVLVCATAACDAPPERTAQPAAVPLPATPKPQPASRNILFLGTSLTAGYGVGADNAFPAVIQQKLDSAKLPFRVINAGLSGETSAGGVRRIEWSLQQPVDVLVLELGANDGLRGLQTPQLEANLDSILARTRARYPHAAFIIAGMRAPPNLGPQYTNAFSAVFDSVAARYDAVLIPFLLEGVAGDAELNQEDGIHPTRAGHARIAGTVWNALLPVLRTRATSTPVPAATE
jgi:acyl-CoA thioesterase I